VAVQSKAKVCIRLTAGIAGSYPAEGMKVRFLSLLCVVQVAASATSRSLFRGVLPGVCLCVI
jgi:hypothetical protein